MYIAEKKSIKSWNSQRRTETAAAVLRSEALPVPPCVLLQAAGPLCVALTGSWELHKGLEMNALVIYLSESPARWNPFPSSSHTPLCEGTLSHRSNFIYHNAI